MKSELKVLAEEQKTLKKRLSLVNTAMNTLHKLYGKATAETEKVPLKRAKRGSYKKRKVK